MTGSTEASSYQRLREDLAYLRLTTAAEQLSAECHRSPKPRGHPGDPDFGGWLRTWRSRRGAGGRPPLS